MPELLSARERYFPPPDENTLIEVLFCIAQLFWHSQTIPLLPSGRLWQNVYGKKLSSKRIAAAREVQYLSRVAFQI
jgi:hypothetical protein